jgi:cupin superfamily acireductone dioxygenase involved in methionine salvage
MCGMPQNTVLFFNRQDIKDQDKKMRNDETLGMYLEDLAANAKIKKCRTCNLE